MPQDIIDILIKQNKKRFSEYDPSKIKPIEPEKEKGGRAPTAREQEINQPQEVDFNKLVQRIAINELVSQEEKEVISKLPKPDVSFPADVVAFQTMKNIEGNIAKEEKLKQGALTSEADRLIKESTPYAKAGEMLLEGVGNAVESFGESGRKFLQSTKKVLDKPTDVGSIVDMTTSGLETVINGIPAVAGLNVASPAVDVATREFAKEIGFNEDLASGIVQRALPFVFGKWVGAGALTSEAITEGVKESGVLEGLDPKDRERALSLIQHGTFLGVVGAGGYHTAKKLKEVQTKKGTRYQDPETGKFVKPTKEAEKPQGEIKPTELKIENPEVLTDAQLAKDNIKPIEEVKPKVEEVAKEVKPEPPKTAEETVNRFISEDAYKSAKQNIIQKTQRLGAGIDPTLLKDYAVIGAYHFENGVRSFRKWADQMINEFGDNIRPYLTRVYKEVKQNYAGKINEFQKTVVPPKPEKTSTTLGYNVENLHPLLKERLPQMLENIRPQFDEMRGATLTDKQVVNPAIDYASKLTDDMILSTPRGTVKNKVESLGVRIYAQNRFLESMDKWEALKTQKGIQEPQIDAVLKDLEQATLVNAKAQSIGTSTAQALQSWSMPINDLLIGKLKEIPKEFEKANPELYKKLKKLEADINQKPTFKDKALFWFYNIILSNPLTDVRNIFGNASMLGSEFITKAISQDFGSTLEMTKGLSSGIREGLKDAKRIYYGEKKAISKFTDIPQAERRYDLKPITSYGRLTRALLPTTRLALEDAFFRRLGEGMESGVVTKKLSKKYQETIPEVKENFEKILKDETLIDPKSMEYREAIKHLEEYEDYVVFQSKLGSLGKGLSEAISFKQGEPITATVGKSALRMVIPFIRTTANIMKAGFDYSPIGFAKLFGEYGKNLSPFQRQQVIRRAVAGSIFMGGLAKMMSDGTIEITGQGASDRSQRDLLARQGYKPNHLYITMPDGTKKGFSFLNVNPFNITFALAGNLSDQYKYGRKIDEKTLAEKMSIGLMNSALTLTDESFLRGANDFLQAMNSKNPDYQSEYLERFFTQPVIPNIVSFPKNVNEFWEGRNPLFEANTFMERLKRRVGDTEGLIPKYDVLGSPAQSTYRSLPFPISTVEEKPLESFILDNDLRITYPSKNTKLGNQKMTDKQYANYVRISGEGIKKRLTTKLNDLKSYDREKAQDVIDNIVLIERNRAKSILRKLPQEEIK